MIFIVLHYVELCICVGPLHFVACTSWTWFCNNYALTCVACLVLELVIVICGELCLCPYLFYLGCLFYCFWKFEAYYSRLLLLNILGYIYSCCLSFHFVGDTTQIFHIHAYVRKMNSRFICTYVGGAFSTL